MRLTYHEQLTLWAIAVFAATLGANFGPPAWLRWRQRRANGARGERDA